MSIYDTLRQVCVLNLILSAVLIPGYWVTFLFIDSWGRKPIQLMGFSVLTILFLILGKFMAFESIFRALTSDTGFGYNKLTSHPWVFFIFYCIAGFFENFGPNVTTFVIPGEIFPTRYRSTSHGISAASGKLGSIIAQIIVSKHPGSLKLV